MLFDYLIRLSVPSTSKEISQTDRDVLTKITSQPLNPKPVTLPLFSSVPEDILEEKKLEAQEIANGYKEVEKGVDNVLDIIEGRTNTPDFTLFFDEKNDADLLHALRSLFSGNPNSMNYKTYLQLLRYSMELGREISEGSALA